MGAERNALVAQFLGESFMMCIIALVIALLMAWILLPFFNNLTHKNLRPFDQPVIIWWILGLTLLTGLLAGIYPAFYLSAFKPVSVLKGKIVHSFSATAIRKGLVVFQFTISICLVLGAIVIWQQLNFLQDQQMGFNKNQQIILPMQYDNTAAKFTTLKNELLKNPHIKSVTSGSTYPGIPSLTDMLFYAEGKSTNEIVDIQLSAIENDYIKTLGFTLLHGRSHFPNEFTADSAGIILNETAVKDLGYSLENAVGKKIYCDFARFHAVMQIVGVVKNFNFESLHYSIKPFGFTTGAFANKYSYTIASVASNNYPQLLKEIERSWITVNPSVPFEYSFLDQDFQRNYGKEQLTARIVAYFTFIAILIACLGLFGLAAFFPPNNGTKEIGIRKVLGASVTDVTALLSKEFIKLILVAIVIASPIAWWAMTKWLQDFAYKISISWWMIGMAGLIAIVIALITISFQSVKAALMNPVKSLKSE